MNFYQEIRLLPNKKNNLASLWVKVYQQIHIALTDYKNRHELLNFNIGLSIPDYIDPTNSQHVSFPLGDKVRLFARTQQELEDLNIIHWLSLLEDYAQIKTIKPVPNEIQGYGHFVRKSVKGEKKIVAKAKQMAEFKAKETGESVDKWFRHYRLESAKLSSLLPYIQVSRSNKEMIQGKHSFKLFINKIPIEEYQDGVFDCYGLSSRNKKHVPGSVPLF